MKHLYELPTDDAIVSCLANDVIGRIKEVMSFCSIIDSFKYSTIVSLDGSWGSGKTFFVKQAKMLIDWKCKPASLSDELLNSLTRANNANQNIYNNVTFEQNHSTVYYDAWENDDTSDPILSIINAIIKSKQVKLHIPNERDFVNILSSITECITGRSINALCDAIRGDNFFEDIKKRESINELMTRFLEAAIGEECNRLVVFIDELDRCKPSFAVLLLERIKHFFNDNRLTFVFSLNRDQLQHTIRNFYGNGMNASKYLDKFFDINISIPSALTEQFVSNLGLPKTKYFYDSVCYAAIKHMNMQLREIAKYISHLKITSYNEAHDEANFRRSTFAYVFGLIYIVPVLTALKIVDQNQYDLFIHGKDGSPLFDIVTGPEFAQSAQTWILDDDESYTSRDGQVIRKVNFDDRLKNVYESIFAKRYTSEETRRLGKMTFDENTKTTLLELVNPISSFYNEKRG